MNNTNREEILRVNNLKQHFKSGSGKNKIVVKAVDDISFSIYKGEVFSLVGESGCGKTTTGRSIIKLYQSTGGEAYFHGTRIFSDVQLAKSTYKDTLKQLKANKKELLESKDGSIVDVSKINDNFNAEKEIALNLYKKSKKDRKFESVVDPKSREESKLFNSNSKEHIEITQMYDGLNKDISAEITTLQQGLPGASSDKTELSQLKKKIKTLKKDIKINELRKKQDIQRFKYNLVNRNRLLMRKMQMIFQDPIASLNPRMTVYEIIAEGMRINGLKNEAIIDKQVKESLLTVGLVAEHASRYPHEFSGGQRQRIGIARALVVDPTLIIADEPISALDVSIRAQVINLLNDLRVERGITILFIAHDLSVVKYFSDRVAVMYFGKIVEIGEKEKIFNNPFHPYTLSLMESIPLPDPIYEKQRAKAARYNPLTKHDYSTELPTLREIEPGHQVLCNTEEFEMYKKQLKNR